MTKNINVRELFDRRIKRGYCICIVRPKSSPCERCGKPRKSAELLKALDTE